METAGHTVRVSVWLGGLLNLRPMVFKYSQSDEVIKLSTRGVAIGIMVHINNIDRNSEIAILRRPGQDDFQYTVEMITNKTNTGTGFTVMDDNSGIKCSGFASPKYVYIYPIGNTDVTF